MKILLTGASGFLGRNFLSLAPGAWSITALYRNDASFPGFVSALGRPNVTAVRCDLMSAEDVRAVAAAHGAEWDCCVFLAAKVDIPWSVRDPAGDLLSNVTPVLNLLGTMRAERLIYFSSGAVYDGLSGEVHPGANLRPTLPYAISKQACERYVEFFQKRRQSIGNYLIVRFFGAYGPYEAQHKIFTRLIRAFAVEKRDSYKLYGDGTNLIDAMYVDDAVDALCRMIAGANWNDTVNLAGGNPVTIETLVRETAMAIGGGPITVEREGVAHESNRFWGSTGEMESLYGFKPKVGLAEGMRRFRDFALQNWPDGWGAA